MSVCYLCLVPTTDLPPTFETTVWNSLNYTHQVVVFLRVLGQNMDSWINLYLFTIEYGIPTNLTEKGDNKYIVLHFELIYVFRFINMLVLIIYRKA